MILFILGTLFSFFAFNSKNYNAFIFQISIGPILIFLALQLLF